MSLPGDIPCLIPCQNNSCPYCAFGACMDNTPCDEWTDGRRRGMRKRKIVEPSKAPWSIEYMGKQEAVIHDADGRIALVCPVHNAELIVNAVNAYAEEEK